MQPAVKCVWRPQRAVFRRRRNEDRSLDEAEPMVYISSQLLGCDGMARERQCRETKE